MNITDTRADDLDVLDVLDVLDHFCWCVWGPYKTNLIFQLSGVQQFGTSTLLNVLSVSCATHSRMKSFSSWYSIWPSSGTGSVSRIFSVSKLLSAHTETHIKHVNHLHVWNSEGIVPVTADGQVGGPTGERVRAEGRVSGEAGGGASQQVWEGRGDGGERRLPPPLQHLRELVLMQRPRETTKFYYF